MSIDGGKGIPRNNTNTIDPKYTASIADVKAALNGQAASFLTSLGVASHVFNGRRQACPICKAGTDRFRWIADKERYICNQCTANSSYKFRDAFNLLSEILGISNSESIKIVAQRLGLSFNQSTKNKPQIIHKPQEQKQPSLAQDGSSNAKIKTQDHTTNILYDCTYKSHVYLVKKAIYHKVQVINSKYVIHYEHINETTGELKQRQQIIEVGSIIIPLFDVSNPAKRIGAQLIFNIDGEWVKRPVIGTPIRDAMSIIHGDDKNEYVGVSEGWATAKAVQLSTGFTVIMACDANGITTKIERIKALYPDKKIIIFADNDENKTGIIAAQKAAMIVPSLIVLPPKVGDDWGDYYQKNKEKMKGEIQRQICQQTKTNKVVK